MVSRPLEELELKNAWPCSDRLYVIIRYLTVRTHSSRNSLKRDMNVTILSNKTLRDKGIWNCTLVSRTSGRLKE